MTEILFARLDEISSSLNAFLLVPHTWTATQTFTASVKTSILASDLSQTFVANGSTVGTISAAGKWALGSNIPVASLVPLLDVNASLAVTAVPPISTVTPTMRILGPTADFTALALQNFGSQNLLQVYQAAGTPSAPTGVLLDSNIINFQGWPFDGTNYGNYGAAQSSVSMKFIAAENLDSTHHGTKIIFATTPLASVTRADAVTIQASGGVSVGLSTDPGVGVVSVLTGFRQGTMTAGRVLRSDGTNFVSNTLGITDISGLGANVATALAIAVGSTGGLVPFNGALGTPASGVATNLISTTSAIDTSNTSLATNAFVINQAASATPLGDGTAAVGTSTRFARGDHVHPIPTQMGVLISKSTGVNFNSANTDTALAIVLPPGYTRFIPWRINFSSPSAVMGTATFGLFSGAGATGIQIYTAGTVAGPFVVGDATAGNAQSLNVSISNISFVAASLTTANTIFFRVGTAQGSSATADIAFEYFPMP